MHLLRFQTKKIVKRGVTELVTPGVSYNDLVLENKKNNFLAAVVYASDNLGVSFLDISTGEFLITEGSKEYIAKLLQSFSPSEVIFQKEKRKKIVADFGSSHYTFAIDNWVFNSDYTSELLLKQFNTKNLKGFGIDGLKNGKLAFKDFADYVVEQLLRVAIQQMVVAQIVDPFRKFLGGFDLFSGSLV